MVVAEPDRAGDLPFDEESFDTVLLGGFLAGWAGRERPVAEARRVLRRGGRLIVAVPYAAGPGGDPPGISLRELLAEVGEFAVGELTTVDGDLCLLADRTRERSRATVWRRALGVAEAGLAKSEAVAVDLRARAVELEANREREGRALADVRGDVERLETALAGAAHQRDLAQEKARLASDGVAELERRVERLRRDHEREVAERERDLAEHGRELAEHEQQQTELVRQHQQQRTELERQRERQVAEAERELTEARTRLEERQAELELSRKAAEEMRRELADVRQGLGESERKLAASERDLAVRIRELGQVGEELAVRERELDLATEQLTGRSRELEAVSATLESQGTELSRVRETALAVERERDEARSRLEAREQHLKTAQLGVESRDRKLESAERKLGSREAELTRLRSAVRDRERKLALSEARLEKSQQRAEHFRGSLLALREGSAYRLMRILWRLRRPFRRAPRREIVEASGEDAEPAPPAPERPAAAPSGPSSPPKRERLRVASILDEMSQACFAPECELVPLSLERWAEQLDEAQPDLLLVESAWNANGGEWQYRIAEYPRKDLVGLPALRALLDGCRERGIRTAFWNKEDPVHFERFSAAAALFDHVFTTDARCVERYQALLGERTVTPLPFAAQPRIHNPIAAVPARSASPCFAGAWYRDRHPDRRQALEALLDAARPHGLVIYDRRFGADDDAFGFPDRFAPHILGKLPYERVLDVYKSHRVFLNANSVVDSPTMCSRRVFELAACDTAIVSTPGAALAALLGEGTVEEVGEEATAAAALARLLEDDGERARRTRAARRAVFADHTYAERLATIAATAGLDVSSLRRKPFATPNGAPALTGRLAAANGTGDRPPWLLALDPGVTLPKPALADLAAATTFVDADVIGVGPTNDGTPAPEHRHVADLDPRALLLRRELIEARGQPTGPPEQIRAQLRTWNDEGIRLYAADGDLLTIHA